MDPGVFFFSLPFLNLYSVSALRCEVNIPCLLSTLPAVFPSLEFCRRKNEAFLKNGADQKVLFFGQNLPEGPLDFYFSRE